MSATRTRPRRSVGSTAAPSSSNRAQPSEPVDPALLVAEAMLTRAFGRKPGRRHPVAGAALVVVQTPSAAWDKLVCKAWGKLLFKNEKPFRADIDNWWGKSTWAAILASGDSLDPGSYRSDRTAKAVGTALWRGVPLVGVSSSPETLLPPDLVQAADHRLNLHAPIPEDVDKAVRRLTGTAPKERLTESEAAGLTPRLLRLARRLRHQGAEGYIAKLRELLARETVSSVAPPATTVPSSGSPRAAPTLERLHGMDEAVAWGLSLRDSLQTYAAGALPWSEVDVGALLSGPPGVGKTLFARALAASCDVRLIYASYSVWLGSGGGHQGSMLRAMRETFAEARKEGPVILFIDEVDSFPDRATLRHGWETWDTQVVNALLAEIDGVQGREGVVLVAACNHPRLVDPALIRSGRLDRHIRIPLPGQAALEKILREHLGADLAGVSLSGAAVAATGATGADCERFVRGARRRAREAGRDMELSDLAAEIDGEETRGVEQLRIDATHEAGHAVAICTLFPGVLEAVSLRNADGQAGRTLSSTMEGRVVSAGDIHARIVCMLAGRAAEEVMCGAPTAGAGGGPDSDLGKATWLAATAAASFGLSAVTGLVWQGAPGLAETPSLLAANPKLSAHVRATLDAAYAEARALITARRAAVEAVANILLERRALTGAEAAEIIARHPSAPGGEAGACKEA